MRLYAGTANRIENHRHVTSQYQKVDLEQK